jgi:acetyl esterase/lipase
MTTSRLRDSVSRRTALAGLGAGGLGMVLTAGRWTRASAQEAAPAAVQYARDIVYGEIDGQPLLLDVALPPTRAELRPAVILIHGGGLVFCDRSCLAEPLPLLAAAGYVTFNIEYRLFSEGDGTNPWPAQLDDVQRAVRWIRTNAADYGVDPQRIAAFGHSSGAQLAAFLGTRDTRDHGDVTLADASSRVTCVVEIAGGMDMTLPSADAEFNATNVAILGGTADAPPDRAAYRDFSPIAFVDAQTVPFLVLQGGRDAAFTIDQSRRMVEALHTAGVEVIYGEYPAFDHLSIINNNWQVIGPEVLAFLGRHLRPEA